MTEKATTKQAVFAFVKRKPKTSVLMAIGAYALFNSMFGDTLDEWSAHRAGFETVYERDIAAGLGFDTKAEFSAALEASRFAEAEKKRLEDERLEAERVAAEERRAEAARVAEERRVEAARIAEEAAVRLSEELEVLKNADEYWILDRKFVADGDQNLDCAAIIDLYARKPVNYSVSGFSPLEFFNSYIVVGHGSGEVRIELFTNLNCPAWAAAGVEQYVGERKIKMEICNNGNDRGIATEVSRDKNGLINRFSFGTSDDDVWIQHKLRYMSSSSVINKRRSLAFGRVTNSSDDNFVCVPS